MGKSTKQFVPAGPSREISDREINPGLAAMRELYSLMIACHGNGGARTCHVLPGVDTKRLDVMQRAAKYEGFQIEIEARGDGTVVTLSRSS